MEKLTLQSLKDMKPETHFASGEVENSPNGIYMTNNRVGEKMKWIAVRGGYWDWAIYINWADAADVFQGPKLTNAKDVAKLVDCDTDALNMYRFQ